METIQSLSRLLAEEMMVRQPEEAVQWDIRGEIAQDVVFSADMIAVLAFSSNTEEVYCNRTQRLTGSLMGQFLIGERTNEECEEQLNILAETLFDYLRSLRYSEVGDAVVLQATCDNISFAVNPETAHYAWEMNIDMVVQF